MANECIPLYRPGQDISAVTTGAVVGKTFLDYSAALTTGLVSVNTATAAGKVCGVAAYDAASGSRVAVIRGKGQIVPVTSGAAVTALAEVEVGASGKAVTFSAGVKVGRALNTVGAANAQLWVELY
jgi:hypothetical protein